MTGTVKPLPAIVLAGLLAFACAASKEDIRRFQEDHGEFRGRMVQMDDRLDRIEAELDSLRNLLGGNVSQSLRAMRADQSASYQELERRFLALTSRLEDNERRLSNLMDELESLNQSLQRFAPTGTAASASSEERNLYDQSQADYLRGEYELARMGYRELLDRFPDSDLADDALYWLGEAFMAENKPDSARAAFEQVEQRFPESARLPATLLKRGILRENAGDRQGARTLYRRIVQQYPESQEAEQARIRLDEG
ncbi:MAG: Cell division coordinator CpoB [Calditrichaeota bacterium]|nr:Cell division coordinator CpoB [Calditrichota bacterium]